MKSEKRANINALVKWPTLIEILIIITHKITSTFAVSKGNKLNDNPKIRKGRVQKVRLIKTDIKKQRLLTPLKPNFK